MIPHDPGAFTQGLEFRGGFLWETTGHYGSSSLRKTDPETGQVLQTHRLPDSVFAEGFTFLNDSTVCVLTWREGTAFLMNPWTMEYTGEFPLETEGWGLCMGDGLLYQTDGTATLRHRCPETFQVTDSVTVTLNGVPQVFLNELEFRNGLVLANQWRTTRILFINPGTGNVERVLNLRNIVPGDGEMNGIAVSDDGNVYVAGKYWPLTYVLEGVF